MRDLGGDGQHGIRRGIVRGLANGAEGGAPACRAAIIAPKRMELRQLRKNGIAQFQKIGITVIPEMRS